jgi:hypothetical protein
MVKVITKGTEDCLFNNSDNVKIVMEYKGLAERMGGSKGQAGPRY